MLIVPIVLVILFLGIIFKVNLSKRRQLCEIPVKLDLMFYNKEGLKCEDGKLINGNILIKGNSFVDYGSSNLKESFLGEIYSLASTKTSDWFLSNSQELQEHLQNFGQSYYGFKIQQIEIKKLELGEEFFFSAEPSEESEDHIKEKIKDEVQARIEAIESEHEKEVQKHEAAKAVEMKRVQEEVERATKEAQDALNKAIEENERYLQEALKREEGLNKKNFKNR